jgi:leukotriene-A4 hydrolase
MPVSKLKTKKWSAHEWQHFLDNMPESVTKEQVAALDGRFHLSKNGDAAIRVSWYRVAIRHGYEPAYPDIERFLTTVGRMRYVNPLYRELAKTEQGRVFARRVFDQARASYHPIGQAGVERILI